MSQRSARVSKKPPKGFLIPPLRVVEPPEPVFKRPTGLRKEHEYRVRVSGGFELSVEILFDPVSATHVYHVEEPRLTDKEKKVFIEVMNSLIFEPPEVEPTVGREEFLEIITDEVRDRVAVLAAIYEDVRVPVVMYYVIRESVGFSYIDPLMHDPYIEDISCNGPNRPIYVWHRRYEYIPTTLELDEEKLDTLVLKLVHMAGKHISIAHPVVDAILPGGHRLAATFKKEVTTSGSTFTIRKFREKPITITELISWRTLDARMAAYFWVLMEHKKSGLIMGVTGAGKTTLLNSIATLLKPTYKVVTVEDTPELRLPLPNWVQLVSRTFGEAGERGTATEITLFDLVKVSLRYRPDVIIVGEVRGEEAYVLFQAIATGHGGLTTIHAEHIDAAVKRLTSPPMNIPPSYIPLIDFALLVRRVETRKGGIVHVVRRVAYVWEVVEPGNYITVFRWDPARDVFTENLRESKTLKVVAEETGLTLAQLVREIENRARYLEALARMGVYDYRELASYIQRYYISPEEALAEVLEKAGAEG